MKTRHIGGELKQVSNLLKRRLDAHMAQAGLEPLTGMQGWIIGYLADRPDQDVFQRDIEQEFEIRRSTATGILQLMERKGLLRREPVAQDARLKKLVLTPQALAMHQQVFEQIHAFELTLYQGLTAQDVSNFFDIMDKLKRNLE